MAPPTRSVPPPWEHPGDEEKPVSSAVPQWLQRTPRVEPSIPPFLTHATPEQPATPGSVPPPRPERGSSVPPARRPSFRPDAASDDAFAALHRDFPRPPSFHPPAVPPEVLMELDALRQALVKAAEQNATLRKEVLQDSAGDLVALASAMAERVVRRELKADPSIVATWAQEGIAALLDKDSITVAVSSDIAQILPVDVLTEALGPDVHVLEDAHLPPYSCEVRAKHARVDVGLRGQLDAVFGALEEREKEP